MKTMKAENQVITILSTKIITVKTETKKKGDDAYYNYGTILQTTLRI